MKLCDLIERLDKTVANDAWVDLNSLANELGVSAYEFNEDTRLKGYYVMKWLCTDTWVGAIALFLDDVFVGYSYQSARKSDIRYFFTNRESYEALRQYVIDSIKYEELDYPETYIDMDEEMEEGYHVNYNEQLLTKKFIYSPTGENVVLSRNRVTQKEADEFGEYRDSLSKIVIHGIEEIVVPTKDLLIPYPTKEN